MSIEQDIAYRQERELAEKERLRRAIESARITAIAHNKPIPLFVMVECAQRTGGQLFHRAPGSTWAPDTGPYRQIATILSL